MLDKKVGDIQILRALAIGLVLAHHLALTPKLIRLFPNSGAMPFWAGVELFFVISGLVVTQSVFARPLNAPSFILRRLFRLWPALIFFTFINATVLSLAAFLPDGSWGKNALATSPQTFVHEMAATFGGYFINIAPTIYSNGQMWSLAVEFQFYAAFAILIALFSKTFSNVLNAHRATWWLALILFMICLARRVSFLTGTPIFNLYTIHYLVEWRFDFLLMGVLISRIQIKQKPSGPALSAVLIIVPLILASMSEVAEQAGNKPFLVGVTLPVMSLCFGWLCVLARSDGAFVGQGSRTYEALCWIGDRSYSIYLLHFPVLALQWIFFYRLAPSAFNGPFKSGLCQAAFVIPVTLVLAEISFRWIETPGQALGRKLIKSLSMKLRRLAGTRSSNHYTYCPPVFKTPAAFPGK